MQLELSVQESQTLEQCEAVIERGLRTFVDVGNALLEIRDGRLYRGEYKNFTAYCQERWGFVRQQADRLIGASQVVQNLTPIGVVLPEVESQARPLTRLEPEQQREVWTQVVEEANRTNGKITGGKVQAVVDQIQNKPHVSHNSGNNEWYTPPEYIEAARLVMGGIDLDPASSDKANEIVQAATYYTAEDDGLMHSWRGRVWMNPPYSADLIGEFCRQLQRSVMSERVSEACVLVNNATETDWFNALLSVSDALCLIRRRVKFIDVDGNPSGAPLQGQIVLYIGQNVSRFSSEFSKFGTVLYVE